MNNLDYQNSQSSDGVARGASGGAPGKRALTDGFAPRPRGGGADGGDSDQLVRPRRPARGSIDPFDFSFPDAAAADATASGERSITVRGVVLSPSCGDPAFRALEETLSRQELIALRRSPARDVAAVLGHEAVVQDLPVDGDGLAAVFAVADAYVAWLEPQPSVTVWMASLARLEAETEPPSLPATTIAELRALVATLPPSLRGPWYQTLHARAPYASQRDNTSDLEKTDGGTCALTSMAMALTGMGYDVTPDGLITTTLASKPAGISESDFIGGGAQRQSVEATDDDLTTWVYSGKAIHTPAFWTGTMRAVLACGYGAVLSVDGHVVRVQEVRDDAVIVDDPYGQRNPSLGVPGAGSKWVGGKNYRAGTDEAGAAHDVGADSRWPFDSQVFTELNYVRIIAPRVLTDTELARKLEISHPRATRAMIDGVEFAKD